jgi:hypothetical protein
MSITLDKPYVTLDNVKIYCGISLSNTEFDENVKWAINRASRLIDGLTDRFYYKKTYTSEYFSTTKGFEGWSIVKGGDADTGGYIFTPQGAPIISITTLIEDDDTLVENTDFYVDYAGGKIEKASGNWNENPRKIIITCEIGYDSSGTTVPSSDIPGDIEQYALEIAARMSGHFTKAKINYAAGGVEQVDLHEVPKWIVDNLRALRPIKLL